MFSQLAPYIAAAAAVLVVAVALIARSKVKARNQRRAERTASRLARRRASVKEPEAEPAAPDSDGLDVLTEEAPSAAAGVEMTIDEWPSVEECDRADMSVKPLDFVEVLEAPADKPPVAEPPLAKPPVAKPPATRAPAAKRPTANQPPATGAAPAKSLESLFDDYQAPTRAPVDPVEAKNTRPRGAFDAHAGPEFTETDKDVGLISSALDGLDLDDPNTDPNIRRLLVIDSGVHSNPLTQILDRADLVFEMATTSSEAATQLKKNCFDVVLVDVETKGMASSMAVEQLRAANRLAKLVAFNSTPENAERFLDAGYDVAVNDPAEFV